jgi:hypothetical protein
VRVVGALLEQGSAYDYVSGELWHIVARLGETRELRPLLPLARREIRRTDLQFSCRWGLMAFMMSCQRQGLYRAFRRVLTSPPLLQSLLVPLLRDSDYSTGGIVRKLLLSRSWEPGVTLGESLVERRSSHITYAIRADQLCPQVRNVFSALRIIRSGKRAEVDPIGEILAKRYGIQEWLKWRRVLRGEYSHALQILVTAEGHYDSARSEWLSWQNSFNDALFRSLQYSMQLVGINGWVEVKDRNGILIKLGVLLNPNHPFPRAHPVIATPFRDANERRNCLPGSHPYEQKGGTKARYLARQEQQTLTMRMGAAYAGIVGLLDPRL